MNTQESQRLLRRRLNRIGWGMLAFLAATEVCSLALSFLPGFMDNDWLYYAASYAVMFGLGPLALWLVIRRLPKGASPRLPLSGPALARSAVYCIGIGYLFNLATTLLLTGIQLLTGQDMMGKSQDLMTSIPTSIMFVLAGIIAPICEELIFRRLLLDRLRPFGDRCAIWICGIAFGLYHINLGQFFYASALGMVLAGLVLKTGKLYHSIICHASLNLSSLIITYLIPTGRIGSILSGVCVVASMLFAVWCFVRYARSYRHTPPAPPFTAEDIKAALPRCAGLWTTGLLLLAASILRLLI